jgi:hypothetical protein
MNQLNQTAMNITRDNYEAWFLDYHEGNLNESQMMELLDFLVLNPDLAEEFKSFEIISLEADTDTVFAQKDFLKKPFETSLSGEVEEKHLIAWYEGDLTEEEKSKVNQALARDPELRRNFELYGMSRLQPEKAIIYPSKQELKKYVLGGLSIYIRQFAAAAAVIAIVATIYFMLPDISTTVNVAQDTQEEITDRLATENQQEQPAADEQPVAATEESIEQRQTPQHTIENTPVQRQQQPSARQQRREPIQLAQLNPVNQTAIQGTARKPEPIEARTEFFWLTYADGMYFEEDEEEEIAEPVSQTRNISLASLAYEGLEKRTGISLDKTVAQAGSLNFWDIAGMGLAGLGQLTGTSLTVDRERDEEGRTRSFGIGDRFRIRR